jgi:hypothetical protein
VGEAVDSQELEVDVSSGVEATQGATEDLGGLNGVAIQVGHATEAHQDSGRLGRFINPLEAGQGLEEPAPGFRQFVPIGAERGVAKTKAAEEQGIPAAVFGATKGVLEEALTAAEVVGSAVDVRLYG